MLGQKGRAGLLMGMIGGVYLAGLLIGGVTVVDQQGQRLAYAGQAMLAPTLAVDAWRSRHAGPDLEPRDGVVPAVGRPLELGVLYTSLAGMLNLLAILDVAHRRPSVSPVSNAEDRGVTL